MKINEEYLNKKLLREQLHLKGVVISRHFIKGKNTTLYEDLSAPGTGARKAILPMPELRRRQLHCAGGGGGVGGSEPPSSGGCGGGGGSSTRLWKAKYH